jgi:tetratricopeptide (TPR) repeat protein
MLRLAPEQPMTEAAAKTIESVTARLETGTDVAAPTVRQLLLQLNPYRRHAPVQAEVSAWARRSCDWVQRVGPLVAGHPTAGDEAYRAGRFEEAVAAYAAFLRTNPRHADARNNLALAEMRLGNDLCAQLNLEVLRRLKGDYLPALINLTVVNERLGLSSQARLAADRALIRREDIPQAKHNAAWYALLDGEASEAALLLAPYRGDGRFPRTSALADLAAKTAPATAAARPAPEKPLTGF